MNMNENFTKMIKSLKKIDSGRKNFVGVFFILSDAY